MSAPKKKCYYEVLGIQQSATDEDIKKAYRKLALQLHPDKNPQRLQEAKEEFQLLQEAHAVLSDRQERAWYDQHRLAILRGGLHEKYVDDTIDLAPYGLSSCFKGYGDDDEGFYAIYRRLFEKITVQELEATVDEDSEEIPAFGDSKSNYEDVVGPFYIYFDTFRTRKNFAWLDVFDTRQAPRKVSRLMEKENKKVRDEGKREWNHRVRQIVGFMKRKDKRVQAWRVEQESIRLEKEKAVQNRLNEEKARRLQERKKLLESVRGVKRTEHHEQVKEMETWMNKEYGKDDQSTDDERVCSKCELCNKVFRSMKAFSSHERSKKHQHQLQLLQANREEANGSKKECENDIDFKQNEEVDNELTTNLTNQESNGSLEMNPTEIPTPSKNDSNEKLSDQDEETEKNEVEREDNNLASNLASLKLNKTEGMNEKPLNLDSGDSCNESKVPNKEKKKRRRAPKASRGKAATEENKSTRCQVCGEVFISRDSLFRHLQSQGHATFLPQASINANTPSTSQCKKSKAKGN